MVALLGRNGAGKTTTLKSVMGVVRRAAAGSGSTARPITRRRTQCIARAASPILPETRGIFPSLSVLENLKLVDGRRPGPWSLERVLRLFPRLRERARPTAAISSPAASSRCWPSPGPCC